MLDVSIVFLQTSKITQRDDRVLLSRPFSRHLAPFPPNFPIQRPSNTYICIQYTYIYTYIYTYVHICSSSDSFTCWWTFRLRDQKDFARLLEGMLGGFHHGAPPKAEWSGLSKGCLSYARISEARGISLVLENADALRERDEERCGRQEGEARGEVPLGWNTIYINRGGSFALWKVAYFRPYFVSNRIFPLNWTFFHRLESSSLFVRETRREEFHEILPISSSFKPRIEPLII